MILELLPWLLLGCPLGHSGAFHCSSPCLSPHEYMPCPAAMQWPDSAPLPAASAHLWS